MPSNLVVEVCRIGKVSPHPNAERLELAIIRGWQTVVPKGKMQEGQLVVYFPPATVLPKAVTDRFEVTTYTSTCAQGQRIRQAKLRGEPSFGLVVPPDDPSWTEGMDVATHYGAVKWDPPLKVSAEDVESEHPLFIRYTEIENMRNFPAVIADGEEVVATEKIHGCFHSKTKIMLANGEEREISEVRVGHMILSWSAGNFQSHKVLSIKSAPSSAETKWMRLHFDNGRSVTCTADHLFLTKNRKWVQASDLTAEDDLVSPLE